MKKLIIPISFILLLVIIGFGYQATKKKPVPAKTQLQAFEVQKNITYCQPDGQPQLLDLYQPNSAGKHPLVVHIHGGSWTSGQKNADDMAEYLGRLATAGFAVASINYRLAPAKTYPAQLQDAKCAVRFLRTKATDFNLTTDKIGVIGESAGGHLAALLATTPGLPQYETSEYPKASDAVSAVADLFGPSDLASYATPDSQLGMALKSFLGTSSAASASPTSYVTENSPPFLLVHGDSDVIVPMSQSEELYNLLRSKNVSASLITVTNAGHGLELVKGDAIHPSIDEIQTSVQSFFKAYLR